MDDLKIYLKGRGQYFKIMLGFLLLSASSWSFLHAPKTVSHVFLKKLLIIHLSYLPTILESAMGLSALFILYVFARQKVTKIEAGRVNLAYTHGLFDRQKDALDLTTIQFFTIDCNPIDWILMVRSFAITARSPSDGHLVIHGMGKADADLLFKHLSAYANRSYVKYRQSQPDRDLYNAERGAAANKTRQELREDEEEREYSKNIHPPTKDDGEE